MYSLSYHLYSCIRTRSVYSSFQPISRLFLLDILLFTLTNLVLTILSSNNYLTTSMMDRVSQILLLSLLNTTAVLNQHNYKKQLYLSIQPMNTSFLSFFFYNKKYNQTMENALQFTNLLLIKTKQQLATTDLLTKYNITQKHFLLTQIAPKSPFLTNSAKLNQQ